MRATCSAKIVVGTWNRWTGTTPPHEQKRKEASGLTTRLMLRARYINACGMPKHPENMNTTLSSHHHKCSPTRRQRKPNTLHTTVHCRSQHKNTRTPTMSEKENGHSRRGYVGGWSVGLRPLRPAKLGGRGSACTATGLVGDGTQETST